MPSSTVAIAVHGTRGDVEPAAVVARELVRRGHAVRLAVPPNLVGWVEGLGLGPVQPYGVDSIAQLQHDAFTRFREPRNPRVALAELRAYATEGWEQMGAALDALADGAHLVLTGTTYQEVAATVAEARGLPLASLHYFPLRPSQQVLPVPVPRAVVRPLWAGVERGQWQLVRGAEQRQRASLGLPPAHGRSAARIAATALEVQAYEPSLFPGLEDQWPGRPFCGALTLGLAGPEDERVLQWASQGPAPVYVGLGSMGGDEAARRLPDVVEGLLALGQRVLVSAGSGARVARDERVLVVGEVGHAAVLPACRAVVHHGGMGTTAAGLRAGRPTLVLWVGADQPLWGRQVRRLGVGGSHRLARVSPDRLRAALRDLLDPAVAVRARALSARLTDPAGAARTAVDAVERQAWRGR